MTVVSGDITIVTETPALITEVRVHAPETRTFGDGVMTTLSAPVSYSPQSGEVLFNAAPGPAVLSLKAGSRPLGSVALVVGDVPQESLRDAYERAALADGRTVSELEQILEQIRVSVGASAEARAGAEAAAEDAAGSAASAGRDAARAETAAGEAATEAAGLAADAVRLEVKGDADRSAAGAATATEKAAEAAGSATRAEAAEAGAVEAEEGAEAGQELSEDAAAVAVAAAIGVQAAFHQHAGVGFPEGRVSAPVGSIYVDTAATAGAVRWIKTTGTGNTGWRVEWGDTGVRDITSQIHTDQGWDLDSYNTTLRVSRQGGTCFLSVASIISDNPPSGYATVLLLPAGFRPRANVYGNTWRGNGVWLRTNGLLQISGPSTILDYWQTAFDCPPEWPSTRPGVPA